MKLFCECSLKLYGNQAVGSMDNKVRCKSSSKIPYIEREELI
jgi:hypothetical protein